MKTNFFFSSIFASVFLLTACSDESTGEIRVSKTPDLAVVELDDSVGTMEDIVPSVDTIPKVKPPPPPMPSPPMPPDPWPDPWPPRPEPWPDPPIPEIIPVVPVPEIADFPDVEPSFPGGEDALRKFITDNIQYPKVDLEAGNQGRVFLSFHVELDGSITNIKVERGVSETIDREAKRIVQLFPKWIPGRARDRAVVCRSRIPITFKLD